MNYCPYNNSVICPYAPAKSKDGWKVCLTPASKCEEWRLKLKGNGYFSSPVFQTEEYALMKKEEIAIEEGKAFDNPISDIEI